MFERKLSCQYIRGGQLFCYPGSLQNATHSYEPGLRALSFSGIIRCRSSILYRLVMFWELALDAALGMKRIFSIIII